MNSGVHTMNGIRKASSRRLAILPVLALAFVVGGCAATAVNSAVSAFPECRWKSENGEAPSKEYCAFLDRKRQEFGAPVNAFPPVAKMKRVPVEVYENAQLLLMDILASPSIEPRQKEWAGEQLALWRQRYYFAQLCECAEAYSSAVAAGEDRLRMAQVALMVRIQAFVRYQRWYGGLKGVVQDDGIQRLCGYLERWMAQWDGSIKNVRDIMRSPVVSEKPLTVEEFPQAGRGQLCEGVINKLSFNCAESKRPLKIDRGSVWLNEILTLPAIQAEFALLLPEVHGGGAVCLDGAVCARLKNSPQLLKLTQKSPRIPLQVVLSIEVDSDSLAQWILPPFLVVVEHK